MEIGQLMAELLIFKIKKNMTKRAFSLIEISVVVLIIGILISSVSVGIDLYSEFKLSNAKNLTKNSIVNRIYDLSLWLETSSSESFDSNLKDNSSIIKWKNIGINISHKYNLIKHNPLQTTPTTEAIYKTNIINNLPGAYFNGTSTCMEIDNNFDSNTENYTIFVLLKNFNTVKSGDIISKWRGSTDVAYPYTLKIINDSKYNFAIYKNPTQDSLTSDNVARTDSVDLIIMTRSKENSKIKLFINKYQNPIETTTTISSSTTTTYPLCLGCRCGNSENVARFFSEFYLGELIFFKRELNSTEIKNIYDYLSKKWKI